MLKKYKITYSATVGIEYKRIFRKNVWEEYNIPKEYTEFFYDDEELTMDIINNMANKDACYVVRFVLPTALFGDYDYSSAKVEELIKHGTIKNIKELIKKP